MLVGAVDIYANHPVVFIGSTDPPELDWDDAPACSNGKHIVVRTRGQSALTRVSIWHGAMPVIGDVVFDGVLNVEGSRVCVADLENLTRWVNRTVVSGSQRVVVCVDDPDHASRVHVGFGLGDRSLALTAVARHPLPAVRVAPDGQLLRPNELGLILDGHDSPLARLAAAIKLLALPADDKPWPNRYCIGLVTEWLRGLASRISFAEAETLGQEIADRLRADDVSATDGIEDEAAWTLATHVVDRMGLR
ncbi:hypothetical protein [Streptomyces cadmiisoli]|uniref:Uncharacterized protein n=1 Tax=Streptomyces cadmiisoli TaxID=2184053 RepID=A0A2Z4ISM6_9ACTN|nr:hypothetical protein [Streptomyces cadmiisoli]AWW35720.1 hypothetical protein DN051_02830 [Streptomyces cadmiisoli]